MSVSTYNALYTLLKITSSDVTNYCKVISNRFVRTFHFILFSYQIPMFKQETKPGTWAVPDQINQMFQF